MPLISSTTANASHPRVILGLMTFGPEGTESKGARITSLEDYNKCLDFLQQHGYNEIDTARVYIGGEQEAFTRAAHWQERGLQIATKCYPVQAGDHSPQKLRATLETSLKELGVGNDEKGAVDIFYLHAPDRSVPFADTLKVCDDLFKEGKFVRLGLSNFAAWEVAEVWNIANERGWVKPTVYQAMYNAVTRDIEKELVPCCRKYGLDIVVYNPLAGGMFSGKYRKKDEVPKEGRFANVNDKAGKMYRDRYFQDSMFNALQLIQPVVEQHGLTLLETALRWVVHHSLLKVKDGGNDGIIIGVSSISQLEGNIHDLEKGPLPEEIVKVLDEAWDGIKYQGPSYWR